VYLLENKHNSEEEGFGSARAYIVSEHFYDKQATAWPSDIVRLSGFWKEVQNSRRKG